MKNKSDKTILISDEKYYISNKKLKRTKEIFYFKIIYLIIILCLLIINLYYILKINQRIKITKEILEKKNILFNKSYKSEDKNNWNQYNDNIDINKKTLDFANPPLEIIDSKILESIQDKIEDFIELIPDERKFFHGIIRKVKPKKIVEIGVSRGGSASLILNAIKDIEGAKLYSIDKSIFCYKEKNKNSGYLVKEKFPELMDKWTLFLGGLTGEYIETIGNGIDLVFIDTVHLTPGEMLDWLMVLPFLKDEAILVLHDTFFLYYGNQVTKSKRHTSNNQLFVYIRGEVILPNYGDSVFFRNIGAIKLAKDQKLFYLQYFLALGIQWEYMPNDKDLKIMRDFFMKYYGQKYVEIFDDAVEKNKIYLGQK